MAAAEIFTEPQAEEDETAEDKRYPSQTEPRSPYPQVDETLPKLAPEDEAIVEAWCKAIEPFYSEGYCDADEVLRRVLEFNQQHPALFRHLGLHEELLFELGAELGYRGKWEAYLQLLARLRLEQPWTYTQCFGFYDLDLIEDLIVTGRREQVPALLSFFKQYPDTDSDNCNKLVDVLAWCGLDDVLHELALSVAVPFCTSPKVLGGDFVVRWLIFHEYVPFLDRRDYALAAAAQLAQNLAALRIPEFDEWDENCLSRQLRLATERIEPLLELGGFGTKRRPYEDLAWRFCGFLHDTKGLSWVRARFLADALVDFHLWGISEKRPREVMEMKKSLLDQYLASRCGSFDSGFRAVSAYATLQAAVGLSDFTHAMQAWNADKAIRVRQDCAELFSLVAKAVPVESVAPRLYPTFESLYLPNRAPAFTSAG